MNNIWLAEIWRAWRASVRKPGFLLLATGVLALGIGSSVGIFTLIDQVLMQPLPLPNASRVMVVGLSHPSGIGRVSPRGYQHFGTLDGVVSTGLVRMGQQVNIAVSGPPQVVSARRINHTLLPTLGLHPVLGHNFTVRQDSPNGPHVVMLSYGFWQQRYGGQSNVLGKTLDVKGEPYTIVGVLPRSFGALPFHGGIVLPMQLPAHSTVGGWNSVAVARLAPGASSGAVSAQVTSHLLAMYAAMGLTRALHEQWVLQPLATWQHADARSKLSLFMACALFVLLTALVNLVNLMLLRSLSRAHDSAVRGALGASPWRLALPSLAEGLLVGILGALVGTAWATLGLHALEGVLSVGWLPAAGLHVPFWVWLLAVGVSVACAVLAAAVSVWRSQRTIAVDELREGGRSGLGRQSGMLGRALVIAQVMLATVLLCGTGLLLHGLYKAANTPLGFSGSHMLAFNLKPLQTNYPDAQSVDALSQRLVRRLEAIPGVTAATVTTNLPTGAGINYPVRKPGGTLLTTMQFRSVGTGYFKLFDIPVLQGRGFTRDDVRGGTAVAVVNRKFAERVFGGHARGQTLQYGIPPHMHTVRIVGVVGNTRQFGPLVAPPEIFYVPLAQLPSQTMAKLRPFVPLRFVLGGHGNVDQWRAGVRAAMAEVAPNQPISDFRTLRQVIASTTSGTRRTLLLIGIFAALALLLAAAGMYAVMAVSVAAREREFGVRTALGAAPSRLVRLVMRGGLVQIVIGLVIGVAIVLGVSGLLTQMLVSIVGRANTFDPVALICACAVLAIAGLLACLLPALRAGRVQPMHALRGE